MSRREFHPRHQYHLKDNSRLSFLADQAEVIELNDDETAITIRYSHEGAISIVEIEGDKLRALYYTLVEHYAVPILEDHPQWFAGGYSNVGAIRRREIPTGIEQFLGTLTKSPEGS